MMGILIVIIGAVTAYEDITSIIIDRLSRSVSFRDISLLHDGDSLLGPASDGSCFPVRKKDWIEMAFYL